MYFLSLAAPAAHGEAAGGAAFPPFDPWHFPSQLFWLAILFGALYLALSRFILPKLGGVIESREDTIADSLDEAARLNEQSKEAKQQQDLALAEARAKARETADKARAKVEAEIAAETAKVDGELAERLDPLIPQDRLVNDDDRASVQVDNQLHRQDGLPVPARKANHSTMVPCSEMFEHGLASGDLNVREIALERGTTA